MKKRGKPSKFSAEQRKAIAIEYLTGDKSCREIGEEVGVSGQTIYTWATDYKKQLAESNARNDQEEEV